MLGEEKTKQNSEKTADVKFVVMPEELRMPPKKINKNIFILAGAVLATIVLSSVIFAAIGARKAEKLAKREPAQVVAPSPESVPEAPTAAEEPPSLTAPPPAPEEKPEEAVSAVSLEELAQGKDNDADGLTDREEAVFGTDQTRPDTDQDGYLDGNEVFHLYNPSALAPVNLLESGFVKLYRSASGGYEIYYLSLWTTSSTLDGRRTEFLSTEVEKISLTVSEAEPEISLRSWYLSQYPAADINELQTYVSKKGYQGLQDKFRLNTYLKSGGRVLMISYEPGTATELWYRRVYEMMLNSLKID